MFRFGTVWSLPIVYAVLLLLSALGATASPSLQGLVDLAGIASVCLIVPSLFKLPAIARYRPWLIGAAVVLIAALQAAVPGTALSALPHPIRHILVFAYAFIATLILWAIFQTAGRGKRGVWWLRAIFVSGAYLFLVLFTANPDLWSIFTIPCALILLTFRPLRSYSPWSLTLTLVGALVLFFALISESGWKGSQMMALPVNYSGAVGIETVARNLLDSVRYFLAIVAIVLVLRIALHGILGIYSPNIRVRSKLTLTVLLSSVIPGILMLAVVALGVAVVGGGYCASLAKSMLVDRIKPASLWLDSVEDLAQFGQIGRVSDAGILRNATLNIFRIDDADAAILILRRIDKAPTSVFGDSLELPKSVIEQRTGFFSAGEQLMQFAVRTDSQTAAIVYVQLDRTTLEEIKTIVGVDIELYRPKAIDYDTSDSAPGEAIVEHKQVVSYGPPVIVADADTLRFLIPSQLSTQIPPGALWYEKSLYFGINYIPVIEISQREIGGPEQYVLVVRTSLKGLYDTIFSQTNTMNRVAFHVFLALALIFLLTVALIWGTGVFVARSISSGAAKLVKGTQKLRQGDLDVRIPLSSKDELGEVATSFNLMAGDLKRMMQDMAEKERIDKELAIARSIQMKLLPTEMPQIRGIDVFGASEPATEVGGDCYDFILTKDRRLALSIGDVSGKGMAAALLMANLQASLRMLAVDNITPGTAVRRLNESICHNTAPGMFVTFFLGVWNPDENSLRYVNAGHDYPIVMRGDGFESLETGGVVLGVDAKAEYEEGSVILKPGDWLFLYSDGITEARDEHGRQFDVSRLQELFRKYRHHSAHELVESTLSEVLQFSADPSYEDDRTLVAFHVLKQEAA